MQGHGLGTALVQSITINLAATNLATSSWTEIDAALNDDVKAVQIITSSNQICKLGKGASGAEVDLIYIVSSNRIYRPSDSVTVYESFGLIPRQPLVIPAGTRIAARAVTDSAAGGFIIVNFFA